MKNFWNIIAVILLACTLVLGSYGGLYLQSGWLFSMARQAEEHEPLALTPAEPFDATETKTMAEWLEDARVSTDKTLILVNFKNPLPKDYKADLTEYNGAQMHPSMVENYINLRDRVQEETGIRIYVSSDFRTAEKQAELLEYYGPDRAAPVGCSEHEAGLSLDVYAPGHDSYNFLKSPAGRMVNRICHEYGFIIRYEADKTDITGIDYEPWHLRYVGVPHAELIANSGLAYEEYIEAIKTETWYSYNNYLILRTDIVDSITLPEGFASCHISPDNMGYYIVTVKL